MKFFTTRITEGNHFDLSQITGGDICQAEEIAARFRAYMNLAFSSDHTINVISKFLENADNKALKGLKFIIEESKNCIFRFAFKYGDLVVNRCNFLFDPLGVILKNNKSTILFTIPGNIVTIEYNEGPLYLNTGSRTDQDIKHSVCIYATLCYLINNKIFPEFNFTKFIKKNLIDDNDSYFYAVNSLKQVNKIDADIFDQIINGVYTASNYIAPGQLYMQPPTSNNILNFNQGIDFSKFTEQFQNNYQNIQQPQQAYQPQVNAVKKPDNKSNNKDDDEPDTVEQLLDLFLKYANYDDMNRLNHNPHILYNHNSNNYAAGLL